MSFLVNALEKTNQAAIGATMATLHGKFGTATKDLTDMFSGGQLGGLMGSSASSPRQIGTIPTWHGGQSIPNFTNTVTNVNGGRGIQEGDNTLHLNTGHRFPHLSPIGGPPFVNPVKPGPVHGPPVVDPLKPGPVHPFRQPGPEKPPYNPMQHVNNNRFSARRKMISKSMLPPMGR